MFCGLVATGLYRQNISLIFQMLVPKAPKKLGTAEEEQNGKAKAQEVENEEKEESFVLVSNIPSSWHTHHLR